MNLSSIDLDLLSKFFDFRKGIKEWPSNAELVDQKAAESLLEKAMLAAEELAKLKKKDSDTVEEEGKQGKSKDNKEASSSASKAWSVEGDEDDAEAKIHPETAFETLKDGSSALIIKPGFRYDR